MYYRALFILQKITWIFLNSSSADFGRFSTEREWGRKRAKKNAREGERREGKCIEKRRGGVRKTA